MTEPTHLQQIRQEMPATTSHIYLNTGTFGPLPACVIQTMNERLQEDWQNGRLGEAAFEAMRAIHLNARTGVARLLKTDVQEVALTGNTTEGLNIIIHGFNWQEGDEVITTTHEHHGVLAPLYQIRDRYGVEIRFADIGPRAERPALSAIAGLITPRTRLIVLSHIVWTTGALLDINEVGRMGQELGIPVLVDGAQSAGAIPIDVTALGVDFYAIPMQKWLCGPDGTGALYVRREAMNYVAPTYVSYASAKHEEGVEWALHENAQRFELGARLTAAIAGQATVLKWLEETVGHEWLFERIRSLHTHAYSALQTVPGLTLLTPKPGASGLISFMLENRDPAEVVKYLNDEHNIYIRNISSTKSLRVSTGFYNTEEEIDTLVKALREIVKTPAI